MDNNQPDSPKTSGGSGMWIIIAVIVIALIAVFVYARNRDDKAATDQSSQGSMESVNDDNSADDSDMEIGEEDDNGTTSPDVATGEVKTFNVEGGMFYFNPSEIKVNKGDTVKIIFTNKEGFHDWVIDEFNARTPQIQAGKTAEISFVADKSGRFEYYCSVGQHRQMGMKGSLIVEE